MQDSKKSVFHWDSSELALILHHPNFKSSLCFALVLISRQTMQSMSDKLFNITLWLHVAVIIQKWNYFWTVQSLVNTCRWSLDVSGSISNLFIGRISCMSLIFFFLHLNWPIYWLTVHWHELYLWKQFFSNYLFLENIWWKIVNQS